MTHPTVGVARLAPNVSDQLGPSSVELSGSMVIFSGRVCLVYTTATKRWSGSVNECLRELICFG